MPDSPHHSVVTGGSSGIGRAVVQHLVQLGERVTVFDLRAPDRYDVEFVSVDVTDEALVERSFREATSMNGRVDGLVTCHGIIGQFKPALELDLTLMGSLINVHVIGMLTTARALVRRLEGHPASIVGVSSIAAYGGWANQSDYGVAKAAVRQLIQNLAIEWAPLDVRVNAVAPGQTMTPMLSHMVDDGYEVASAKTRTPLHKLATPEQVAAEIVHLLRGATHVTGHCLPVDGGWTAVGKEALT
ncbi:SDR family NAD(P)-dependent oxidoreductase [Homoserinimonas sp. A520]